MFAQAFQHRGSAGDRLLQMRFLLPRVAALIPRPCRKASWQSQETSGSTPVLSCASPTTRPTGSVAAPVPPMQAPSVLMPGGFQRNALTVIYPRTREAGHRLGHLSARRETLLQMCCVVAPSYTTGRRAWAVNTSKELCPQGAHILLGAWKLGTLQRKPKQVPGKRARQAGESGRLSEGEAFDEKATTPRSQEEHSRLKDEGWKGPERP